MGRTDSKLTKEKILAAAERLFSEKGYDGTGIEEISRESDSNKALIYYHFQSKQGLLLTLYERIMEDVKVLVGRSFTESENNDRDQIEESLRSLVGFLKEKRNLLKILLMESMKGRRSEDVFMELARTLMQGELEEMKGHGAFKKDVNRFLVFEFFTGFMPIYNYVVYSEKWAGHFGMYEDEMEDYFIQSFMETHLAHHKMV